MGRIGCQPLPVYLPPWPFFRPNTERRPGNGPFRRRQHGVGPAGSQRSIPVRRFPSRGRRCSRRPPSIVSSFRFRRHRTRHAIVFSDSGTEERSSIRFSQTSRSLPAPGSIWALGFWGLRISTPSRKRRQAPARMGCGSLPMSSNIPPHPRPMAGRSRKHRCGRDHRARTEPSFDRSPESGDATRYYLQLLVDSWSHVPGRFPSDYRFTDGESRPVSRTATISSRSFPGYRYCYER